MNAGGDVVPTYWRQSVELEGQKPAPDSGEGGGRTPHQYRLAHRGGQPGKKRKKLFYYLGTCQDLRRFAFILPPESFNVQ